MHHRRCSSPIRIVHINPLWGRPAVSELTGVDIGDSNMTLYDIYIQEIVLIQWDVFLTSPVCHWLSGASTRLWHH